MTTNYAKTLTFDRWNDADCDESVIEKPVEADLREAVDRLDQRIHTVAIVGGEGEAHLAIGGGSGGYVVYATYDNVTFYNLMNRASGDKSRTVVVGGQAGDYPAHQVVTRSLALLAATRFLTTGQLGDDLGWEVQP